VSGRAKYEPNYPDGVVVIVIPSEARRYGFAEAGLLNQVRFWSGHHRTPYLDASSEDLADLTGLSPDSVRRCMRNLIEAGAIGKERQIGAHGDRKCRYRVLVKAGEIPLVERVADPPTRGGDSANPGGGGSANPSMHSEEQSGNTSPAPPQAEGGLQPELFAPGAGGAATVGERQARAGKAGTKLVEGAYRAWLERWPKGNRGSVPAGLRAFAKAVKAGATMEDLDRQAVNYQAARVAYHEAWRSVGNYWPSLMHCSSFLNGKREMFDHEWGADDLRYWPAPAGWSWDDRPVTSHDAGEVPAEIQAQGGLAVAMWRAEQRKAAEAGAAAGG
jgi:hypothetical protein